ncbi:kinesin-like protein KIF3C isoform X2 [Polyodon spathula]|uniref:kinesin-like protein KIF3C isoform X2 n=1 Tax=Polyodon spathula TaxID=7913 RepID=UPI001B7EEC6E|nr:kinesin-like protein KIF3C isoform X2 [Polyodon spathula]
MDEVEAEECKEAKKSCHGNKGKAFCKSFRVVIRICPRDPKNDELKSTIKVKESNKIIVDTGRGHQPHILEFDAVWDENGSQKEVYESAAKPLVGFVLQGFNGCVITYGSPASGKTYTLQGGSLTGKQRGIITRAAEDIFNSPEASNCTIRASFIHISNEKMYDLLDSQPQEVSRIHESEESVFLEGLTEVEVASAEALLQLYRRGTANRNAGVSKGEFASKSHIIFNIIIINTNLTGSEAQDRTITTSRLTLVDLASSGRVSSRGAISDGRRYFQTAHENPQEAKILKRSLTIFGNVIFALSSPGCQHIPYRESKLTRILRDCLGGNCLTSLIVTVSSDLSSVHETLSTLQFATRAMAIPSRPVRNSQIQSCGVQVNNAKNIEKPKTSVGRPQTEFPCIGDNKAIQIQTCLPPILFSPSPPSRCNDRRRKESLPKLEHPRELKVTLPHLEKSSEKIPYLVKSAPAPEKNKPVEERGKSLRSRSSSLAGPPDPLRDKQPRVEPASPRVSVERLPAEMLKALECPNCKKERRIRDEYDKYIIQSRRDKDSLQQKIAELEADLRRCKEERVGVSNSGEEQDIKEIGHGETVVETHRDKMSNTEVEQFRKNLPDSEANEGQLKQTCNVRLQQAQLLHRAVLQERDGLLIEIEVLKAQLDKACQREKAVTQRLKTEKDRVTLETEDLRSQLEKSKEREKQLICRLENEKARILLELEDMKAEFKKFKDRVTLTLADLKKEKDGLLIEIEETKNYNEKIKSENSSVLEKLETLQRELSSKHNGCYQDPPLEPPYVHSMTTNTEMMMIQVSQQSAAGIKSESRCCFNGCSSIHCSSALHPGKSSATNSMDDEEVIKIKDMFKQLKRERNLLLDVMVIMYTRRWFIEEAMPHVKRTIRKCGMRLEDTD